MTLVFPEVNVWMALSGGAFKLPNGLGMAPRNSNAAVMGTRFLNLNQAWEVCDRWLRDERFEMYPEPHSVDHLLREFASIYRGRAAPKLLGDCYRLAFARD